LKHIQVDRRRRTPWPAFHCTCFGSMLAKCSANSLHVKRMYVYMRTLSLF